MLNLFDALVFPTIVGIESLTSIDDKNGFFFENSLNTSNFSLLSNSFFNYSLSYCIVLFGLLNWIPKIFSTLSKIGAVPVHPTNLSLTIKSEPPSLFSLSPPSSVEGLIEVPPSGKSDESLTIGICCWSLLPV